jgi:hypothetical protein
MALLLMFEYSHSQTTQRVYVLAQPGSFGTSDVFQSPQMYNNIRAKHAASLRLFVHSVSGGLHAVA